MDMSIYLLIGIVISGIFAFTAQNSLCFVSCGYWFVLALWAVGIIEPFTFQPMVWVNVLDVNLSYQIDGLSRLFSLLISGIGIIVFIYAYIYTQDTTAKRCKLFSLLQLFAVSMMVLVLANDTLMLFLGWELTSISSYLLIQFDTSDETANQAAFNSLFVSVLGSLALLLGFVLLNHLSGTWSINYLNNHHQSLIDSPQITLILGLFLCAVITKSAQFPFYFWLAGAMKAPTPVSAYLHSATMVNAGIYLLARFHSLFSEHSLWYALLSLFGLVTMSLAAVKSLLQTDLKGVLAYTTIFVLGAMVYLLGGRYAITVEAFALLLLFHGIYKAGAFMLVGTIDKQYHTRELKHLHGIARNNPVLALSSIIIFGAMAGLPPFYGFTVKEMIFEAKLATPTLSYLLMGVSILSSMLIAAASFRCLWYFFSTPQEAVTGEKKLAYGLICPLLLAVLILLFSVYDEVIRQLIEPVIQAVLPIEKPSYTEPYTGTSYLLSMVTVIGGILILLLYVKFRNKRRHWPKTLSLKALFEAWIRSMLRLGRILTHYTQGQSLTMQLRMVFAVVFCIVLISLPIEQTFLNGQQSYAVRFNNWLACVFLSLSALSLVFSRNFLVNLISLSLLGFASSYFFLINGAIDVAITQLLVEVLTIIILLIALRYVTTSSSKLTPSTVIVNAFIAGFSGLCITLMLWYVKSIQFNPALQNYFAENSLDAAHGKNIVNVILVDFRSLDTFGEAMVIVTAAIGIALLLKKSLTGQRRSNVDNS